MKHQREACFTYGTAFVSTFGGAGKFCLDSDTSRETLKVASLVCKRNVGPTLRKVKLRSSEFAVIERVL